MRTGRFLRVVLRPICAAMMLAAWAAAAVAQNVQPTLPEPLPGPAPVPPAQRPAYQPYRYDEDWSVLRDPRLRTDPWDPIKYVPLRRDDWYLSVGGEWRWRYEQVQHPAFGAQPDDGNGYLLQRYLLHTDWHLGRRARVFVELQSGLEAGRVGGPRPTDEDRLDLHQAFADLTWGTPARGSLTVRVGRQEVAFGAGRLISAAEGLNVRRSFDGVRLTARRQGWSWNAVGMSLVGTERGLFDDHADRHQLAWGAGGYGPHPWIRGGRLALYYLGLERKAARFDQGTADATRHVAGIRTWGTAGRVDYDEEAIVQWGSFGQGDIRAWAVASEHGVTPRWLPWSGRAGLRVFVASGDRNPADATLGSFDPLFPGIAYSGKAGLIGPTNLVTIDPSLALAPHRRVRVTIDWARFWRTRLGDGVYGINVAVLRTGRFSQARGVGSQATVEVEGRLTPHLTVWGSVVAFRAGPFLTDTPPGRDVRYAAAHLAYRF